MHKQVLIDETKMLNLGFADVTEFVQITKKQGTSYSSVSEWPSEEKQSIYKLNSFIINLSQDHTVIERQTYSLLEWIGDIGGLFDGLLLLGRNLIAPFAAFALKSALFTEIFAHKGVAGPPLSNVLFVRSKNQKLLNRTHDAVTR